MGAVGGWQRVAVAAPTPWRGGEIEIFCDPIFFFFFIDILVEVLNTRFGNNAKFSVTDKTYMKTHVDSFTRVYNGKTIRVGRS